MPILRGPEDNISKNLTEAEKELGVDLKRTQDNDLELSNLNDVKLVAGGANAAQAIKTRLLTEPRGLLFHPNIGTDLMIGEKTKDALAIKLQIIKSISQDPRFENVEVNVNIDGNVVFVDMRVSIVNTGIRIPLQFAVNG